MRRKNLLWLAVLGAGGYYLWKKHNMPAAVNIATVPATAAPTTTMAGFGHTSMGPMQPMRSMW